MSSIVHQRGATPVLSLPYTRDRLGLVTAEGTRGFGYDVRNRLVSATGPSSSYAYTTASDLTAMSVAGASSTTMAYDVAHQLSSLDISPAPATGASYAFSYDAQGNRTTKRTALGAPVATYAYDQANRLVATSAGGAYAYDGDGLRTASTGASQAAFTWDVAEGLPLLLHDGTNAYLTGPGGLPLEQIDPSGRVLYYHADQLGSTRALTDATGAVAATYDYDPYGNLAASTTTSPTIDNPLRFAGQYTDAETGFVYLRARYYDPATGQFLSVDPVEGGSCTAYDYVCGDPVNNLDLDGRRTTKQNAEFVASLAAYCARNRSPLKCSRAKGLGELAAGTADLMFTPGSVEWDAFKHVYWHALMVSKGLGFRWSQGFGRASQPAYEGYSNNRDGPGDLINNRLGAVIGQQFREGKLKGSVGAYVARFVEDGRANTMSNCYRCTRS